MDVLGAAIAFHDSVLEQQARTEEARKGCRGSRKEAYRRVHVAGDGDEDTFDGTCSVYFLKRTDVAVRRYVSALRFHWEIAGFGTDYPNDLGSSNEPWCETFKLRIELKAAMEQQQGNNRRTQRGADQRGKKKGNGKFREL